MVVWLGERRTFASATRISELAAGRYTMSVAAIAPVMGTITPCAVTYAKARTDPLPVPVMMVHSKADDVVLWEGNTDKWYGQPGHLSVPETVAFWVSRNRADDDPRTRSLTDAWSHDGMAITETHYVGGTAGADVVLHTLDGVGHRWPGGAFDTSGDGKHQAQAYDATKAIWRFFEKYSR